MYLAASPAYLVLLKILVNTSRTIAKLDAVWKKRPRVVSHPGPSRFF